MERIWTSSNYC